VLLLTSSLPGVFALETSNTNIPSTAENSGATLKINFFVNNTFDRTSAFSFEDLTAMPKTIVYAELSCFGTLLQTGNWGGVSLGVLLSAAGFNEPTADIQFYASDGYTVPYSISDSTSKDVIIAYELDGNPLPETLRLVVPGANGELWISMITTMSINSAFYPSSPNPDAASIVLNQPALQPSSTPQPSPTPKPRDQLITQPTVQPTVLPPTNPPVQQQNASSLNLQIKYGYPVLTGIIVVVTLAIGYLFYRRRK